MMKRLLIFSVLGLLVSLLSTPVAAETADLNLEVQLVWGTNDDKSPDPKHKEVDSALSKKLSKTPYKWKNYFEVNRVETTVPPNDTKKLTLSKECEIELKNLGNGRIEVVLHGNKQKVLRQTESIPLNQTIILGGDAKNDTAWLIVIKRTEAKK